MLAPLDDETIFKKAFTDKIVFTQFVKDIFEIDVEVDKIETEKKFKPKAAFVDITLDIFAQSKDKRIIIEIQRVEYDYHFDRFQNYFLSTIIEQQKSAKKYKIDQTVYSIVVLTTPYTINQITGEAIEDEVLIQDLDPQTLDGKKIKIAGHKQIFLNPHYRHQETTPQRIMDWLDLIYASIKTPNDYKINLKNKGIKRASELIDYEKLDADTITKMKITNETKALHSIIERKAEQKGRQEGLEEGLQAGRQEGLEEGLLTGRQEGLQAGLIETAKNGIKAGFSNDIIKKMTGLTDKEIDELRKKCK